MQRYALINTIIRHNMKEIVYLILGMLAIAQIQIIILANTILRIKNEKK
jgi:hypothetical protein